MFQLIKTAAYLHATDHGHAIAGPWICYLRDSWYAPVSRLGLPHYSCDWPIFDARLDPPALQPFQAPTLARYVIFGITYDQGDRGGVARGVSDELEISRETGSIHVGCIRCSVTGFPRGFPPHRAG